MKSGCLVLFEGQNYWFSELIEISTWSKFSHCGIYVEKEGVPYLFESGYEKIDGKVTWGVQLTPWDFILKSYDGTIFYRDLVTEHDITPDILSLYEKLKGFPYDVNIFHYLRAFFQIPVGNCQEVHSFFCSALTSYVYSELEIFPRNIKWDLVSPKMIAEMNAISPYKLTDIVTISNYKNGCIIL